MPADVLSEVVHRPSLKGFEAMGATIVQTEGYIEAHAEELHELVFLRFPICWSYSKHYDGCDFSKREQHT